MQVFETPTTGKERLEHDMVFVYRMFSKNLVTSDIYFIRDLELDIIWFCPADSFKETLASLLAEFYEIETIKKEEVPDLVTRFTSTFEFFNDPTPAPLETYLTALAK